MEYKDVATYFAHIDKADSTGDPTGADIKPNANGFVMGDVQYYSQAKVDELLASKESEIKSWATSQFAPKPSE